MNKSDLLKNSSVRIFTYSRTNGTVIDSPEKIHQAFMNVLNADTTSPKFASNLITKIQDKKAILKLNDDLSLRFSNMTSLLTTVKNSSADELVNYSQEPTDLWSTSKFPTNELLKRLPAAYTLEKVQFINSVDFYGSSSIDFIKRYCDGDDDIYYDEDEAQDFVLYIDEAPQDEWAGKLLYQLREKSTNKIVSPILDESELPFAIHVLNQSAEDRNEKYQGYDSEWVANGADVAELPVDNIDQLTSNIYRDAVEYVSDDKNIIMDPRKAEIVSKNLIVEDSSRLWPGLDTIDSKTISGINADDFICGIYDSSSLIHLAQKNGFSIIQYYRNFDQAWSSSIENAKTDTNFENYQPVSDTYEGEDIFIPFFEIRDAKTSAVLDTEIEFENLNYFILKNLWSK